MSHRIIIRPEAELDIQEAFEWYDAQSRGLGSEFVRSVDACLATIVRNPFASPLFQKQARRVLLRRFPYGILYVCEQNTISVVACFHSKRNPQQ